MPIPNTRLRVLVDRPVRTDGRYVLYWMIAARRLEWNHALQRALEQARALHRPLVVFEPLRCGYRWASDRLHLFILQGMAENERRLRGTRVTYYPHVERQPGEGRGLLAALAAQACLVVTDDYPAFFLPRLLAAAARRLTVRLEVIDSNGLLPLSVPGREFPTAYAFRRFLQRELPVHLAGMPRARPLAGGRLPDGPQVPRRIRQRWPAATPELLAGHLPALADLPIDHQVVPAATPGGAAAGRRALRRFLEERLGSYTEHRNDPAIGATSGLSPYLHFGHVSAFEVFFELVRREAWTPACLSDEVTGKRQGWWGMSANAEAFIDQLVTWRELGFNMARRRRDHERYASLPDWARRTLGEHADDRRPHLYDLARLESAQTHDPVWNAAQRQLVRDGTIHNYLRMLWGKKVLEWSRTPQTALRRLVHLNNKYALDGRDPNSTSGIFWCLGRYDRPWGPVRSIFGKVRYMSSENTARKLHLKPYLERYGS